MAFLIGAFIGTWALGALLDWAIFKRFGISLKARIVASSIAAIVLAIIIYGFGNANGGPWNPGTGLFNYPIGGLLACVFRLYRAKPDEPASEEA